MLCALIMAGGKGTRFWPLSTEDKPKQFLKLVGDSTMLQMTVNRILPVIPIERIFICTAKKYVSLVKSQLPDINERNIIIEPEGRNTAPCITLSAMIINRYYKDPTMLVVPSDHLINDEEEFRKLINMSSEIIENERDSVITFGIPPTRAETGYGYIKFDEESSKKYFKVDKFVEKPNKEMAKVYFKSGKYLWNSGIFMWKNSLIINEIKKYKANIYNLLKDVQEVKEKELQLFINSVYKDAENISIDYAVLENTEKIYVIPSNIGWDDIGSWNAMERYLDKDLYGNIHLGDIKANDSRNNLIVASDQKIIVDEVSNIYVIENNGKIIIGKKEKLEKVQNLKKLVEMGV